MNQQENRGSPTYYKPAYCNELVGLMAEGLSLTASMASLGFSRQTAYDWAEKHEEFSYAVDLGHGKRSLFLERKGIAAESGPSVSYALSALKNCNREDFREEKTIDNVSSDNSLMPITKVEIVPVRPRSRAEIEAEDEAEYLAGLNE